MHAARGRDKRRIKAEGAKFKSGRVVFERGPFPSSCARARARGLILRALGWGVVCSAFHSKRFRS